LSLVTIVGRFISGFVVEERPKERWEVDRDRIRMSGADSKWGRCVRARTRLRGIPCVDEPGERSRTQVFLIISSAALFFNFCKKPRGRGGVYDGRTGNGIDSGWEEKVGEKDRSLMSRDEETISLNSRIEKAGAREEVASLASSLDLLSIVPFGALTNGTAKRE